MKRFNPFVFAASAFSFPVIYFYWQERGDMKSVVMQIAALVMAYMAGLYRAKRESKL